MISPRVIAMGALALAVACTRERPAQDTAAANPTPTPPPMTAATGATGAPTPDAKTGNTGATKTAGSATSRTSPTTTSADTALGVVTEVGSDPATFVMLRPASGTPLRLSGAEVNTLKKMSRTQVWVSGAREAGNAFRVDAFEVRRVNDQPVDDGTVVLRGSEVAVKMRSGQQRDIPNAPPALRDMVGARVWVSKPVAGVAPSFGLIQAK